MGRMNRSEFKEGLLRVMERRVHWSEAAFAAGQVPRDRLHILLEQEFASHVKDLSILLGQAYVQCPLPRARKLLAEELYEQDTGGLSGSDGNAELFLELAAGLGLSTDRFRHVTMLPQAASFHELLHEACSRHGWEVGAAVTMVFLEGNAYARAGLEPGVADAPRVRPVDHPLVRFYGLPLQSLALTRAHHERDKTQRKAAWHLMLDFVGEEARPRVLQWMGQVLHGWLHYRDELAVKIGLLPAGAAPQAGHWRHSA
ncbi:iron-containing redox enzyme family protein [Microbulbifer guangxiensis]|uniref:iron-containing redox enzyme family protein n=1 Tax=Microbulbifer guangxiensis TaxID=2904249 RepID=UPI001F408555|nr:iron-containing redox enzyme family protein [Microbulbifer guangxiensis]